MRRRMLGDERVREREREREKPTTKAAAATNKKLLRHTTRIYRILFIFFVLV